MGEQGRKREGHMKLRERKLRLSGGSVAVSLPADFLRSLGWKAGDAVLVSLDGKRLIIE